MTAPGPHPDLLAAWSLEGARLTRITAGHINVTYRAETADGQRVALQRLNPIFGPEVNCDIDAITERLEQAGLTTPRLRRTDAGQLWREDAQGLTWRVMSWIEGHTVEQVDSPERAHQAGRLLGRFHGALWDWDLRLQHHRPGVHDTPRHLQALRTAIEQHGAHRLAHAIAPLAAEILGRAHALPPLPSLPHRLVHGDPKITNVIFAAQGEARALVDLDTVARMPLPLELGDALRSWCAPLGEEREGPLDADIFRAALHGYGEGIGAHLPAREAAAVPLALETIALELAARFCADALQESYFGWDSSRFASAAEHNLQRTRSQLALARSIARQRAALDRVVRTLWG